MVVNNLFCSWKKGHAKSNVLYVHAHKTSLSHTHTHANCTIVCLRFNFLYHITIEKVRSYQRHVVAIAGTVRWTLPCAAYSLLIFGVYRGLLGSVWAYQCFECGGKLTVCVRFSSRTLLSTWSFNPPLPGVWGMLLDSFAVDLKYHSSFTLSLTHTLASVLCICVCYLLVPIYLCEDISVGTY